MKSFPLFWFGAFFLSMGTGGPAVEASSGILEKIPENSLIRSPSQRLAVRLQGDPETLDWNRAHTSVETYVIMNVMEGLVGVDQNLQAVPRLAESWKVSADGRVYTFQLKKGIVWSDGIPLKAQDFVESWKRLLSPATGASYGDLLYDVEGADLYHRGALKDFSAVGIKSMGDGVLEIRLKRPVAYWIYLPSFWVTFPVRRDLIEKYGDQWEKPGKLVTLGPYALASRELGSRIQLKRNPRYHDRTGNVDELEFLVVKEDTTALNLFDAEKIDVLVGLSTIGQAGLVKRPEYQTVPYLKTGYLGFMVNQVPVQQESLRRAIAMSIDKVALARQLSGGMEPASSFVPPGLMGFSANAGIAFNPREGKRLFGEVQKQFKRPIELELLTNNWAQRVTVAKIIQEQLKRNLGLTVKVIEEGHKTYQTKLDLKMHALFNGEWAADFPDPDSFLSVFSSQSGSNRMGWKNAEYDEGLSVARGLFHDRTLREKGLIAIQRILLEREVVIVPLFYSKNQMLIRSGVKKIKLNALNYLELREAELE